MACINQSVSITTDASGDATVYTGYVNGRILGIIYKPGSSGIDTGAGLTITTETTGQAVLTKATAGTSTVFFYPRAQVHDAADGAALTLDGTRKNVDYIRAVNERIKVVVASGGNAKSGSIEFITDDDDAIV